MSDIPNSSRRAETPSNSDCASAHQDERRSRSRPGAAPPPPGTPRSELAVLRECPAPHGAALWRALSDFVLWCVRHLTNGVACSPGWRVAVPICSPCLHRTCPTLHLCSPPCALCGPRRRGFPPPKSRVRVKQLLGGPNHVDTKKRRSSTPKLLLPLNPKHRPVHSSRAVFAVALAKQSAQSFGTVALRGSPALQGGNGGRRSTSRTRTSATAMPSRTWAAMTLQTRTTGRRSEPQKKRGAGHSWEWRITTCWFPR